MKLSETKKTLIMLMICIVSVSVCIWSYAYEPKPTYAICIGKSYYDGHPYDSSTYVGGYLVSQKTFQGDPKFSLQMLLSNGDTEYWDVDEGTYIKADVGSIVKRYWE